MCDRALREKKERNLFMQKALNQFKSEKKKKKKYDLPTCETKWNKFHRKKFFLTLVKALGVVQSKSIKH